MDKINATLKLGRLRLCFATLRTHSLKANFNPDQPRVPAGNPRAGEWTRGGQSEHAINASDTVRQISKIDLRDEENHRGAHTLKFHVGKTDIEILLRMGKPAAWWRPKPFVMYRNGSFDSYSDADYFVNQTIKSNIETVRLVASGMLERAFIKRRFGYRTGIEGYRETPYSEAFLRIAYEVGVNIIHDPSRPNGFYVNTAYPRNEDPMKKTISSSPVFMKFTSYMIQDFEMFEGPDDILLFGLNHLTRDERNELLVFLKSILRPDVSDQLIGRLWNTSNAEFGSDDDGIRWLLQQAVILMENDDGTNAYYNRPVRR